MWTTYIAIIILIIFFSFFIKVKFTSTSTKPSQHTIGDTLENNDIPPASSDIARLNEMKYAFLHFANFVLLEKRPFLENVPVDLDNMLLETESKTIVSDVSTQQQCEDLCVNDRFGQCNGWTFNSNSNECTNSKVTGIKNNNNPDENLKQGFVRRSGDNWAIDDISKLPTTNKLFKETAKLVLLFGGAPSELTQRANNVISNMNVSYCYRDEPFSGEDDYKYITYVKQRKDAIAAFENICIYFLYIGDNHIANNKKFVQYAVACTRILGELNIFSDIFSETFSEIIEEGFSFFNEYTGVSDNIYDMFYNSDIETENDGYITKNELFDYLYKKAMVDSTDCDALKEDIKKQVDEIFAKADDNEDGKISFSEFEYAMTEDLLKRAPHKPVQKCSGDITYETTNSYTQGPMSENVKSLF